MMPIVIRASARRALKLVVMGVILVVGMVFLALNGRAALERGVGWFGVIFFGLGLAYAVWVLVRRPILLTIDADGFTDSSTLVSVGRVRWAHVAGIQLWKVSRQTFICVDVLDENQLPRRPAWKRAIDWADRALVGTPIAIGLSTAQVSPDEGLALLEQGWADWKRRNSWPEASATEH